MNAASRALILSTCAVALVGCSDTPSTTSHSAKSSYCTAYTGFMRNSADLITDHAMSKDVANQAVSNAKKAADSAPDAASANSWKRAVGYYETMLRDDSAMRSGLSIDAQNDIATLTNKAATYCGPKTP